MAKSKSKRVISFLLSALMILSSVGTNFFGLMPTSVVHADENYSGYAFPANSSGTDYGTCYVNDSGGAGTASSFSSSLGDSGPTIPNTLGDVSFNVQCWRHKGSEPDRKAWTLGSGTRNYEATWSTGPVEDGKITITWTLTKVYQTGHADAPYWSEPAASPMTIASYRDVFDGNENGGRIYFNFTIPRFGGIPINANTASGQSSAAIEASIESQIQNKIQSYYSEFIGEALNGKKATTDPVYPTVIAHYDSSGPSVTVSWLGYNIHYKTTSDPQRYYAKNTQSVWRPSEIELTAEKWVDPKSGTDKSSTSYSKACDIIGSSKCTFKSI